MSLAALKLALDRAGEAAYCEGIYRPTERLAIALPDGDLAAVDDPNFVDWLLAHAESAPFGAGKTTRINKKVRHALRLVARGAVKIGGFDPARLMDQISAALSPTRELVAKLTDVIVYPEGGKFLRHKDTPRSAELVGTLVVELPIAHTGGAFHVVEGGTPQVPHRGAQDPTTLRWVALFSDVDHEIKRVTSGTRVTLVYSLERTDILRSDSESMKRRSALREAAVGLAPVRWPVMIACTRQVITRETAWPEVDDLRGLDRDIAEAFIEAGFDVTVRACLFTSERPEDGRAFPDITNVSEVMRLRLPMTQKVIGKLGDVLTYAEEASDDSGEAYVNASLARYIDDPIDIDQWVIRARAEATMIHEASMFSIDGWLGNEASEAFLYTLAALEISPKTRKQPATHVTHDDDDGDDGDDDDSDDDDDDDDDDNDDDVGAGDEDD